MANGAATATIGQEYFEEEEEEQGEPSAGVSPLDIDFIAFALPLAFILDVLSYIFMGLDAGVVAAAVNFALGWILMVWMIWRGKQADQAKEEWRQARATARQGKAGIRARRKAIQPNIARGRLSRRMLKRGLIAYIGSSIPIVNFIPFWMVSVLLMLREK